MVREGSSKISEVRLQENGIIGNLEEGNLRKDVAVFPDFTTQNVFSLLVSEENKNDEVLEPVQEIVGELIDGQLGNRKQFTDSDGLSLDSRVLVGHSIEHLRGEEIAALGSSSIALASEFPTNNQLGSEGAHLEHQNSLGSVHGKLDTMEEFLNSHVEQQFVEQQCGKGTQLEATVSEKKRRGRPPKYQPVRLSDRLKAAAGDSELLLEAQEKLLEMNRRAKTARIMGLHVNAFVVSDSPSAIKNMDLVAGLNEVRSKEDFSSGNNPIV